MHAICDDSTTVRRIGGFWYATFNKDYCRTLNDSSFLQRLLSIHIMVLLNGRALLHNRRPKQRTIVREIGLGPPSNNRWSFRSAQFYGDVYNCSGYCKGDVRQAFIQYQSSDSPIGLETVPGRWPEERGFNFPRNSRSRFYFPIVRVALVDLH